MPTSSRPSGTLARAPRIRIERDSSDPRGTARRRVEWRSIDMAVRSESRGAICLVTIDRPEVRNCVDRETAEALVEAFRRFDESDELAVAVLQGEGGCFCAGADLKAVGEEGGRRANR